MAGQPHWVPDQAFKLYPDMLIILQLKPESDCYQ